MKNPDHNYRILMSLLIVLFIGFAYWAGAFYFFSKKPVADTNILGFEQPITETPSSPVPVIASSSQTFSVIVLPDTQKYSRDNPEIFCNQTRWIVDNARKLNIRFVSHLGDIVDSYGNSIAEWEAASKCMKTLDDARIPYSIIPGNHDVDKHYREDGLSFYDRYFPASRYSSNSWYKGNRKQNQNSYQIIEVPTTNSQNEVVTTKLLFLNLEIEPSDNTIAWANDIVKNNPNTYTILITHKYLPDTPGLNSATDPNAKRDTLREYSRTGNTGEDIWNKLVKDNCSIKVTWNGHYHKSDGEYMMISKNKCNDEVHQIIQDYQAREAGGNGLLRIYTFDPVAKTIDVQTYSPYIKSFEKDADSEFEIPFAIR